MNWKSEAVERLRRYDAMNTALKNIPEELERLEYNARGIKASRFDRVPVKGGISTREDALLTNMVQRQELEWSMQQAKLWLSTTDRALSALSSEDRLVLHRMYISRERGGVDRLCGELGCEQSTIYRRRDKALYRFTLALYGFSESQIAAAREN